MQTCRIFSVIVTSALLTLALEAKHNLSHAAIDDVLTATGSVIEQHLHMYSSKVKVRLSELGIDSSVVDDIPFDSFLGLLNSSTKRYEYYTRHLSYREPYPITLGTTKVLHKGVEADVPQIGYIIPFTDSIRYQSLYDCTVLRDEIYIVELCCSHGMCVCVCMCIASVLRTLMNQTS